jgi:hypothetical protein
MTIKEEIASHPSTLLRMNGLGIEGLVTRFKLQKEGGFPITLVGNDSSGNGNYIFGLPHELPL